MSDLPTGHATTYIDSEGEERCECGKWLEPPYYEHADHLRSIERKRKLNGGNE